MSVESFLQFLTNYNDQVIQVTLVIIFGLVTALFFVMTKQQSDGASSGDGVNQDQIAQLEETLKKVIEQNTLSGPASSIEDLEGGAVSPDNSAEFDELKQSLQDKEKELNEIKAKIESGELSGNTGDTAELEKKIKDLEARLQEYEIIEDDIADLSLYKEENVKLKKEMEALKSGEPLPEEPAKEEVPEKEEAVEETPMDVVEEFAEAVGEEAPKEEPTPEVEAKEEAPAEAAENEESDEELKPDADGNYITDDVLAEFSTAVSEELGGGQEESESAEPAAEDMDALLDAAVEEERAERSGKKPNLSTDAQEVPKEVDHKEPESGVQEPTVEAAEAGNDNEEIADLAAALGDELGTTEPPAEPEPVSEPEEIQASTAEESGAEESTTADQDAIDAMLAAQGSEPAEEATEEVSRSQESPVEESEPAPEAQVAASEKTAEEEAVDTDRMLEEMAALTEAAAQDDGTESALEAETDIDKMAEEASKL